MTDTMGLPDEGKKQGYALSDGTLDAAPRKSAVRTVRARRITPVSARIRLERRLRMAAHRKALWRMFVEKFERFTDVLCASAQHGITPESEQEYVDLRTWFLTNYYDHANRLRPHMNQEVFATVLAPHPAQGKPMDSFEAIFLPRTLSELLAHDDGSLISLISCVSQAVYAVEM